jgi:hypothetical protein
MRALAVSHLTVTLRLISNECRSLSSIGATCMIHSSIGMLLPGWRTQVWCHVLDDCCHFVKLSAIETVTSACLIYRQVRTDHRWGSVAVTHHSQSYCHMTNRQNIFLESKNKKTLKRVKNVLWQQQILLICLLVPIVAVLNLVTQSL